MYIARGVCLGMVFTDLMYRLAPLMPELSDEARTLYVSAYGGARYERYNDRNGTCHGARPPDAYKEFKTAPQFHHRPEHDVESVYWSMVSALSRVHPKGVDKEAQAADNMTSTWSILLSHKIPNRGLRRADPRQTIITQARDAWEDLFLDDMKDIGTLLWKISQHIIADYALWDDGLEPDHLHEAVQRLILQHLIDHKTPIELEPDYLRPITAAKQGTKQQSSQRVSTRGAGTGTVSQERMGTRGSTRSSKTRVDAESETGSAIKRKSTEEDTRVSDSSRPVVIVRSSKRLRDNAGLPQPIEEHAEDDA